MTSTAHTNGFASDSDNKVAGEVKDAVIKLQDLIRDYADEAEKERRIPQPVINALDAADVFKLAIPKRYGGLELPIREFLEVNRLIAQADTSTAWVSTLINVCDWVVGRFSVRAQDEVWGANPNARVCGVLAPSGTAEYQEDGLRITGSWGFASGSQHVDWAIVGVPITNSEGEQVDQGVALIPRKEFGYKDTWYVAGMAGTGSNTLTADDIFVPWHRIMSVTKALQGEMDNENKNEVLYLEPIASILAIVLAAPLVGAVQGALEKVLGSLSRGKGISYTFYENAAEAGSTQMAIAQAAQIIDTAHLHMLRAVDCLDKAAREGTELSMLERARMRMDTGYIAERTREAMDILMSIQGAGGFAQANPLQRMWRDLNTASRHAIIGPGVSTEIYGRALLGVKEPVSPFV